MRLGVQNLVFVNSDFKLSKFDRRLRYESDSNNDFDSTITDSNLILIKIDLISIKIDQFQSFFD